MPAASVAMAAFDVPDTISGVRTVRVRRKVRAWDELGRLAITVRRTESARGRRGRDQPSLSLSSHQVERTLYERLWRKECLLPSIGDEPGDLLASSAAPPEVGKDVVRLLVRE